MGFLDFWRKVFYGEEDDAELKAARARHGIKVDAKDEEEEEKETYDPWEEVRNARLHFFMGSWVSRKFHIIGEEKVKAKLAELEKKREEKERKKRG